MRAILFVIPGSHPSLTARLMLERKGIKYRRIDLIPVVSKLILRLAGFGSVTVPALRINGERVQGSRPIARKLEELVPENPLYPADDKARFDVEQAEQWGDEILQEIPRRILWNAMRRDRSSLRSYAQGARLGIPISLAVATAAPIIWASAKFNKATDENVRQDLAEVPGIVKRINKFIADGIIGGPEPNAADFQIAPSIRLLATLADARPALEGTPALEMAERVVPQFPGSMPAVFPESWLEGIRATAERDAVTAS
jgi:glutathione S-transferase